MGYVQYHILNMVKVRLYMIGTRVHIKVQINDVYSMIQHRGYKTIRTAYLVTTV